MKIFFYVFVSSFLLFNFLYAKEALFTVKTKKEAPLNEISLETLITEARKRCQNPASNEKFVYVNDFRWNLSLPEMTGLFDSMYESSKRLFGRAYYHERKKIFVFPSQKDGRTINLNDRFIKSIILHVEVALKKQLVSSIFFSDMGHSHFFIPKKYYQNEVITSSNIIDTYEKILSHPDIKFLYHTAEQLKFLDKNGETFSDPYLKLRYLTRNLVGDNKAIGEISIISNLKHSANTARELPGYIYWGAGFSIHANKQGCFPYRVKNKVMYFDLSLESLPYINQNGIDLYLRRNHPLISL